MKKIFAILMTVAMLLSLGTVLASAELPYLPAGFTFTPGGYSTSADDFSPAGDFKITWDPEAGTKLNLADGDMADWQAADYDMITIDASNMIYWAGKSKVPEGWQISTYFVADSEWLYIGFFVVDPVFAYGGTSGYNGDAFQVCIDFGARLGEMLETDPENLLNPKNVFYSFSCSGDGDALVINRQECGEAAGQMTPLSEATGDGVKGAARATADGWSAEFALSWEQLYDDYNYKAWDDPKIYIGGDENRPLNIGCCLYYLDRDTNGGDLNWAAGSTNGITDDAGTPQVSWTAYDNGLNLSLEYVDGMEFAINTIVPLAKTETIPPEETEAPETDAPETEAPTAAPETAAPETEGATKAPAADTGATETTGAATTEEGCASVVGFGAVAVLAAAAAFVALKKKD